MPRTTSVAVAAIIEVDDSIPLDPFIETASALVDEIPAGSLNDTRLELVERWLSAHFYAIRDPRTTRERADRIEQTFQSRVGLGLANTHYGQQAAILDTTGTLKALDAEGKRTVSVLWLGKDLCAAPTTPAS